MMHMVAVVPVRGPAFFTTEPRSTRLFRCREALEAEAFADTYWRGVAGVRRAIVVPVGVPEDPYTRARALIDAMALAARTAYAEAAP